MSQSLPPVSSDTPSRRSPPNGACSGPLLFGDAAHSRTPSAPPATKLSRWRSYSYTSPPCPRHTTASFSIPAGRPGVRSMQTKGPLGTGLSALPHFRRLVFYRGTSPFSNHSTGSRGSELDPVVCISSHSARHPLYRRMRPPAAPPSYRRPAPQSVYHNVRPLSLDGAWEQLNGQVTLPSAFRAPDPEAGPSLRSECSPGDSLTCIFAFRLCARFAADIGIS